MTEKSKDGIRKVSLKEFLEYTDNRIYLVYTRSEEYGLRFRGLYFNPDDAINRRKEVYGEIIILPINEDIEIHG
jgi:hypothetical protein